MYVFSFFFPVLSRHMINCPRISHLLLETWKVSVRSEILGVGIQVWISSCEHPGVDIQLWISRCKHPRVSIQVCDTQV